MDEEKLIPDHVFETFKNNFKTDTYPNIIRTRNIIKDGLDILINKNKVLWSSTIYDSGVFNYISGTVKWGTNEVLVYFEKVTDNSTYKVFILTTDLNDTNMLLIGLNKYFTIDRI
jgi:hypothetical protein